MAFSFKCSRLYIQISIRGDMNTEMFDDIKGVTRSRKSKKTDNAKSPSPFKGYCRTGNLINIYVIIPASKAFKMQYRFEKQFDSLIR
jgi:hypothetical protein